MDSNFRKNLLDEFRTIYESGEYKPTIDTFGVVALSAAPLKDNQGNIINEASPDMIARVQYSIKMIESIVRQKDISPFLILNGETEQLPTMLDIARSSNFSEEKIMTVNCGNRGVGNTKTQFTILNDDPRFNNVKHLTFITNPWHIPRVLRTASANLRSTISFDILPVPNDHMVDDMTHISEEIQKIELYAHKGDMKK